MTNNSSRPNLTSIAAACILSGGLITAAIIDSHRSIVPSNASTGALLSARATPPIAQDSALQQFQAQINNQQVNPIRVGQVDYYFKGFKKVDVDCSANDDTLVFYYTPDWRSNDGATTAVDGPNSTTATNDGYGHYKGAATLSGVGDSGNCGRYVDFTIR